MIERHRSASLAGLALVMVLAAMGLSACGGGEPERPPPNDSGSRTQATAIKTIEHCLKQARVRTSKSVGPVAREAGVGALAAVFPGNHVDVVVERTADEASSTLRTYEDSPQDRKMRLEQTGAVVAAYAKTPTSREKQIITRCAKGS